MINVVDKNLMKNELLHNNGNILDNSCNLSSKIKEGFFPLKINYAPKYKTKVS